MIKRTVEISGSGNHLAVRQGSLLIARDRAEVGRVPLEDLGVLILDCHDTTYTHAVLTRVLAAGAVIVPCARNHLPRGLFLPQENSLMTERMARQADATRPLKKRLWKQIVQAKIRHQAAALPPGAAAARKLRALVSTVRSGDPANVEAHAARVYWPALLGKAFRRRPDGPHPNPLLNYGYMALRAAVARAVCAAGLHPALGLHHHNRGNAFSLADDLVEPLRPLVDVRVRGLVRRGHKDIDREAKVELLSALSQTVTVAGAAGPLMAALNRTMASLVRCYAGEQKELDLPTLWN